jgi:hypothetical protein
MMIKLVCYKPKTMVLQGKSYTSLYPVDTKTQMYDGYAASVQRRSVSLFQGGACVMSSGYMLVFQMVPTSGRRFGGIDRIVVTK